MRVLSPVGKDGLTGHCGPSPCNAPARHSPLTSGSLFRLWLRFVFVLHRPEKGPTWHGLLHRCLGIGVQSGRGPCSPLGFHGAQHIFQEIGHVAQAKAQGARSLVTVPGSGCLLWPWWGQVALGHRKETSIGSVWPLGTWWRPWVSLLEASKSHGFSRVREPGASARRLRACALAPLAVAVGSLGRRHTGGLCCGLGGACSCQWAGLRLLGPGSYSGPSIKER